jgi:hypothetical protein
MSLAELNNSRRELGGERRGTGSHNKDLVSGFELDDDLNGLSQKIGGERQRLLLCAGTVPRALDIDIRCPLVLIREISRKKTLTSECDDIINLTRVLAFGKNRL